MMRGYTLEFDPDEDVLTLKARIGDEEWRTEILPLGFLARQVEASHRSRQGTSELWWNAGADGQTDWVAVVRTYKVPAAEREK